VRTLDRAVAFYRSVLGFTVERLDAETATLGRDDVRLGLVARSDHEPGAAGSVAIRVDDLESLHRELEGTGGRPGVFGTDEWDGRAHHTFFLREDENGYCYCFFRPA
jgi:predicted enzyme related to lactoylglutathione lyase